MVRVQRFKCADCGKRKPIHKDGGTGYAICDHARGVPVLICYACCGMRNAGEMKQTGKALLYLVKTKEGVAAIQNWPATLSFPAMGLRRMRHPFAREAWHGYFIGPDGKRWSFRNIGDSQIAHCRRLKAA